MRWYVYYGLMHTNTGMNIRNNYVNQILFFIHGYEPYIIFLIFLAVVIGLIDAFSIALLYPMLSEGFAIQVESIPLFGIIESISSLIPIGSTFVHLGLFFILLSVLSLGLQLLYWRIAFHFKKEIVIRIKKDLFKKINNNDYNFFVETKQGDIINVFNQSPYFIEQSLDRILSLFADMISSVVIIGMLFFISSSGLLLVMIGGGMFYLLLNKIGKSVSEKLGNLQIATGQSENKVINEYISGIKPIKALHASEYWKEQYGNALKMYWDKYADYMFIQRIPILAINSLFYITIGVIVLLLYIYYADNFMQVIPVLGTFAAGTMKVLPKFMNLGDYKLQLLNYRPHVETAFHYLNNDQYLTITNGSIIFTGLKEDILLENLNFSYSHTKILDNVNITIQKGKMTAVVGPSGSGKSTITSLILRLYDPSEGKILINGKNLQDYDFESYRDLIGYVSQDPFIYHDTIRNNITFGREYSEIEIIDAATLANAHDFIKILPHGYDTMVGDQGITLSGGEKQRIVIARAMIRKPDLLILDEATSALDYISESVVQQAIDNVAKECTSLIIAHRLTTIKMADNIYVLEKGKVIEEGEHQKLMEHKGKYYEMYCSAHSQNQ